VTPRRPLAGIYLSVLLFVAGEGALHVMVSPYLARELRLEPAAIGVIVGVFAGASLIARLPAGAAYTRARSRRLLLVGGGLSSGAFALVPLSDGPLTFAALMALDGFGWSVVTTTQLAALVAARPSDMSTAAAMGWYSGFWGLGNAIGAAMGGLAADRIGFDASFLALAAVVAAGTAVMVRATRRGDAPLAPPPRRRLRDLRAAVGGMPVAVWIGVLVMVYINFINGVVTTFHPVLTLAAGLTLSQIGILASCRSGASSFVRLGSGALFSRIGAARLTMPLMMVGAGSLVLLPPVAASFALQIPLFLATGLSRGLLRVTGAAEAFDAVGDADRDHGLTAALVQSGLDVGKLSGPVIGGAVAQVVGIATMFQVLPLALLGVYLGLLALAKPRRRAYSVG
jgi:predicted MFS family arabinose efflux permease